MEQETMGSRTPLRIYPCLGDDSTPTQSVNFYFYQDSWAARQVFQAQPAYLVDVGSTVLLAGILSQFAPCFSVDIRPLLAKQAGLHPVAGSVLELPFLDNTAPCLTSMCVLEHIGLGRYGDPLNPRGTLDAIEEIRRIIAPGGFFVFSVPIGREVTEFNACRRFGYTQIMTLLGDWELVESCILAPHPIPYTSDAMFAAIADPVACFCFRKPLP
jgi:SAM-dependent methyltransferase